MPLKVQRYDAILSQAADQVRTSRDPRYLDFINGMNIGVMVGGVSKAVSCEGSDLVTLKGMLRAPLSGGGGESVENIDFDSPPDSMTLVLLEIPGVRGNIFCNVQNGNGLDVTGEFSGLAGEVVNIHQELWKGEDESIVIAQRDFPPADQGVTPQGILTLTDSIAFLGQKQENLQDLFLEPFILDEEGDMQGPFENLQAFLYRWRINVRDNDNYLWQRHNSVPLFQKRPRYVYTYFPKDPLEDSGGVKSYKVLVAEVFPGILDQQVPAFNMAVWYDFTGEETLDGEPGLVSFSQQGNVTYLDPTPLNPLMTTRMEFGGDSWQLIVAFDDPSPPDGATPDPVPERWVMLKTEYMDGSVNFSAVSRLQMDYRQASDFHPLTDNDVYAESAGAQQSDFIRCYDNPRLSNSGEPGEYEVFSSCWVQDNGVGDPVEVVEVLHGTGPYDFNVVWRVNLNTLNQASVPASLPATGVIEDTEWTGFGDPYTAGSNGNFGLVEFELRFKDGFDDGYDWWLGIRVRRQSGATEIGRGVRFKRVPAP